MARANVHLCLPPSRPPPTSIPARGSLRPPPSRLPLPFPTARSGPGGLAELSTLLPVMLLLFKAVVVR